MHLQPICYFLDLKNNNKKNVNLISIKITTYQNLYCHFLEICLLAICFPIFELLQTHVMRCGSFLCLPSTAFSRLSRSNHLETKLAQYRGVTVVYVVFTISILVIIKEFQPVLSILSDGIDWRGEWILCPEQTKKCVPFKF